MSATTPTPTVDDYLACWRNQPTEAAATDGAYLDWEAAWTALEDDASLGVPAAVAALGIVDFEVREQIARLHEETAALAASARSRTPAADGGG